MITKIVTIYSCFLLAGIAEAESLSSHAEMTLDSNYIYRGKTRTDHAPSVNGSIHMIGFSQFELSSYVSNTGADEARDVEVHQSLANFNTIGDFFGYKLGIEYFASVISGGGTTVQPFLELDLWFLNLQLAHAEKFFGTRTSTQYISAGCELPLNSKIAIIANAGYSRFENSVRAGNKNYADARVSLRYSGQNLNSIELYAIHTNRVIVDGKENEEKADDKMLGMAYSLVLR